MPDLSPIKEITNRFCFLVNSEKKTYEEALEIIFKEALIFITKAGATKKMISDFSFAVFGNTLYPKSLALIFEYKLEVVSKKAKQKLKNLKLNGFKYRTNWDKRIEKYADVLMMHPDAYLKVENNKRKYQTTNCKKIGATGNHGNKKGYQIWAIWN